MKTPFIFLALALTATITMAQHTPFMQFSSLPLYYNPGYAGSVESPRLAFNQSILSPYLNASYLSYDQAIKRLHSGVGLVVRNGYNNYTMGTSDFSNSFDCGLAYAAKFNIGNRLAISPAVKIAYRRDDYKTSWFDKVSWSKGSTTYVSENADLSAGVVINTEKFHLGFAIDHINEPMVTTSVKYKIPKTFNIQMGYTFQKHRNSDFSLTTGLLYGKRTNDLALSASARYKCFVLGGGYQFRGYYNLLAGYYSKKCMIGYSVAPPLKNPYLKTYYAHELSVRYIFSPPKDEKLISDSPVKKHRVFKNRKRILQN